MYHIKAIDYPPPGGLDLNISDEEEFSPDKLRSNIERLYMTVVRTDVPLLRHCAEIVADHRPDQHHQTHCALTIME